VIYRVLVLLFAIVLIAAGTERICAEVCSDAMADVLDEDAVIHVVETPPLPPSPSIARTAPPRDGTAPAPALMRVFRPPRRLLV
jgi:hypothetical protein